MIWEKKKKKALAYSWSHFWALVTESERWREEQTIRSQEGERRGGECPGPLYSLVWTAQKAMLGTSDHHASPL